MAERRVRRKGPGTPADDEAEPTGAIPTGRYRRAASLGRLAARAAVRDGATRVTNYGRTDEERSQRMSEQQFRTAEQIVDVLGTMKGAAMKVGQVLSFMDVGLVPPEHREEFQKKLSKLRDMAPSVAFKDMRKVIEADMGQKLTDVFSEFDEEAIGAASIGQVYRARLRERPSGWSTDVAAVKVQYPGIDAAVRSDLQNLGLILRLAKAVAPGIDVQSVGDEIRERTIEELDYELEAQNQRTMARAHRGHPFVFVPEVATELCGKRVTVTEFVEGEGFEAWKEKDQTERNRLAEIVFRFYYGGVWRDGQFSADPHPGNSILMADGRVAFLDFGLFHRISKEMVRDQAETIRLCLARDGDALLAHMKTIRWIPDSAGFTAEDALEIADKLVWFAMDDEDARLAPEHVAEMVFEVSDPRSPHWAKVRRATVPAEYVWSLRLGGMAIAVCSQLDASLNYHRIVREWLMGDAPYGELGEQEAAWLKARGR
jgi:predicted unusual protein kinase regulating ubiquinone biosynthesis (AarF/ABC1/UbiB family)